MQISFDRKINIPEIAWILNVDGKKIAFKRLEVAAYSPYGEVAFCLWGQSVGENIFYPILDHSAPLTGAENGFESVIYEWMKDWEFNRMNVAAIPGIAESSGGKFHPVVNQLKTHPTIESNASIRVLPLIVSQGVARYHQFQNSGKLCSDAYAPMGRILEALRRDDVDDVEACALLFALSQAKSPGTSRPQVGTHPVPGFT